MSESLKGGLSKEALKQSRIFFSKQGGGWGGAHT